MPSELKRSKLSREVILDPAARIRQLSDHGSSVEIDKAIPIRRYYRSGSEMERQARVYYTEGQLDRAFILYNKFATLFIEKLPKHPEYSKAVPTDKARIKKLLKQAFPRAMELKDKLKAQFEREKKELEETMAEEERVRREEEEERQRKQQEREAKERQIQEEREQRLREEREKQRLAEEQQALIDTERDSVPQISNPDSNELAVIDIEDPNAFESVASSCFTDEIQSADSTPQTEYQAPESLHLTATDPNLAHVLPDPVVQDHVIPAIDPGTVPPTSAMDGLTLNENMGHSSDSVTPSAPPPPAYDPVYGDRMRGVVSPAQSSGGHSHGSMYSGHSGGALSPAHAPPPGTYSPGQSVTLNPVLRQPSYDTMFQAPYQAPPILPQQQAPPPGHTYSYFHGAPPTNYAYNHQGQVPPMQRYDSAPHGVAQAPARPLYVSHSVDIGSDIEPQQPQVPVVDRSTKPASLKALSTSSRWEDSEGYRTVIIPEDVAAQFERVASPNTRKNIETCGILAGKLAQNVFHVTHIIVPKQKGQSDSCETVNEEELFDAQDKYDLITLGWIHTHPSQTAFMSSVDLHCHCSYQIMLDEAIAIVCAPRYSQVGMYMLTEPHGLNYITHCEQEGFHDHPKNPPLYEDCKHIQKDNNAFIQIVDLR